MVRLSCVLAAGLVILAVGGAMAVGGATGRGAPTPGTARVFAAAGPVPGGGLSIELRSVAKGAVLATLGHPGGSWTNNGFALSPDGRYVYYTLTPKGSKLNSLLLEQLSASTHTRRLVAHGEQPSVSPDGRRLAYATGEDRSASIVIRDLASGRRRSIDVARLLGGRTDMLNAQLAWLGDGAHLAVFELCCAVATSARSPGSGLHLLLVSAPPDGSLSAEQIALPPATQMPGVIGTDGTRPDSLLVSWLIADDRAAVYRLTFGSSRTTVKRVLTIARSLVVAFAPSGRAVLYLLGHDRPDLWTATINDGRLSRRRRLISNPSLDAYAW